MLGNDRGGFLLSDALRQGGISIGISNFNIFGQGVFLGVFLWAGGIWVGIRVGISQISGYFKIPPEIPPPFVWRHPMN